MNRNPFDFTDNPNPFHRMNHGKEAMVFDPLDELMRSQDSKVAVSNASDSQQRAKVAKQRREKLTVTFDRLKELLIPHGCDPNAGRTKLLEYATELVKRISEDRTFQVNREQ